MCTFICTVCQNKIKEHGSFVECKCYSGKQAMVEDTTKLYDKSFLCKNFIHIRVHDKETCKHKKQFSHYFDALECAAKLALKRNQILKPYQCRVCKKYHLTSSFIGYYDPVSEYQKRLKNHKLYDQYVWVGEFGYPIVCKTILRRFESDPTLQQGEVDPSVVRGLVLKTSKG